MLIIYVIYYANSTFPLPPWHVCGRGGDVIFSLSLCHLIVKAQGRNSERFSLLPDVMAGSLGYPFSI